MPYKVRKLEDDNRVNTCGWLLPNGFYHVVEMTFDNYNSLVNIGSKPNYSVEYVTGKIGFFGPDGKEYDPGDVYREMRRVADPLDNDPIELKPLSEKPAAHKGDELERLREQCRAKGIRFHPAAGAQVLKQRLEDAQKRHQGSLATG